MVAQPVPLAARTVSQSSSQRVGALSPIPSCLGIGGHPSGSGKDTHNTLGPDQREGRGWPMRSDSTVHSAETPQTFFHFFYFVSFLFCFLIYLFIFFIFLI